MVVVKTDHDGAAVGERSVVDGGAIGGDPSVPGFYRSNKSAGASRKRQLEKALSLSNAKG